MAIDEHDILDRAMDAAEAQILEAEPSEETHTPEPEAQQEDVKEQEEATQESPVKAARDERGKFTKAQKASADKAQDSDQEADVEQVEAEGVEVEAPPSIDPPTFWTAEDKAIFAKAPVEMQTAFLRYEKQRNEWANRVAGEAERGKHIEKRATEVFEPYRLKLQANGIKDPLEAAERLLAWNEIFEQDVRTGIQDLMQKNGLTPYDFMDDAGQHEQQYQGDPRVDQALQEAQEAKRLLEQYQQQMQTQAQQASLAQIESFKKDVDESGQPRAQYFEMYRPQIVNAMQEILKLRPDVSEMDALTHAYEFVIGEARKVFGAPKMQQQPQATANVKKAKLAASSVTGAPSAGTAQSRPRVKSIEDAMDRAEEALGLR
jgi:hypothetical protein